jgi:hypothetical protein
MNQDDELRFYTDLWVKQSDLFLKLLALDPLLELAILASWYSLMKDGQLAFAQYSAGFGAVVLIGATVILYRTARYIGHFREKIQASLPLLNTVLTGRNVAIVIPFLCIVGNLYLATGRVQLESLRKLDTTVRSTLAIEPSSN